MPWSWVDTEYSIHQVQHTPGSANSEYCLHPVQPTPSLAYTQYSIHPVQHTPSTTYTEYHIHRVQLTPSTVSTQDYLSPLHSHDYELTPDCSLSFKRASLYNWPPSASLPGELKGKVTLSHSHVCESTYWSTESQHLARRVSTAL